MRAVIIQGSEGPGSLTLADRPDPRPGPKQVLVHVAAAGLNRADLLQAKGLYPPPADAPQDIPGLELAGTVEALGPGASRWRVGQRVMGLVSGGAFAQKLAVDEPLLLPVPEGLSLAEAAAIPEAFLTAFDALVLQGGLTRGQSCLIHAASSGVGTAALQIALAVGARPLGTGRDAAKLDRLEALGLADRLPLGAPPAFAQEVLARTGGRGAEVALELVGGPTLAQTLSCLAIRGCIVQVGTLGGAQAQLDLGLLMRKRARLVGTVLRSRTLPEKAELVRAFQERMLPLFPARLRPVLDQQLPFAQVTGALERMAANQGVGKIVLTWS